MAGSLFSMVNLARIAKVLALLLFVLPWVTVSCAGTPLITMSGVDLATGHMVMQNPMTGATESPPGANGGDIWVIIAAVLILAALAVTFVIKGKNGLMAAMAGAGLAAVALAYTVLVRIPNAAHSSPTGPAGATTPGAPSPEQIAQMIQIKVQIGFWLTLLALIAAVVLNFLAMKGSAAAPAAATAYPPPEPPVQPPPAA